MIVASSRLAAVLSDVCNVYVSMEFDLFAVYAE